MCLFTGNVSYLPAAHLYFSSASAYHVPHWLIDEPTLLSVDHKRPSASPSVSKVLPLKEPQVVPGTYTVALTVDGHTETQKFVVKKDPRTPTIPKDFNKQLELALQIRDRLTAANQAVIDIRAARRPLEEYGKSSDAKVASSAKAILEKMDSLENPIYQTKLRASEDALNFPIKLNNKLGALLSTVTATDIAPTSQSYDVFKELSAQLQIQLDQLNLVVPDQFFLGRHCKPLTS
jgi:hypothetical protein